MSTLFRLITEFFYQPVKPFGTTQPVHFIAQGSVGRILSLKPFSILKRFFPKHAAQTTRIHTNERILEIPFVFNTIPQKKKQKILDVGACESTVALSLASFGHEVTALDFRPYPLEHPNITPVLEDICTTTLPSKTFDFVVCLSTLEHIGFDTQYGKASAEMTAVKAVIQMHRVLKPGGTLILTIPTLATHTQTDFMQFFTPPELAVLLKPFTTTSLAYFHPSPNHSQWYRGDETHIGTNTSHFSVALITATK